MFIIAIGAFCLAYYFVHVLQFSMAVKRFLKLPPERRLKPFDCVQCLSVWFAVCLWFLPFELAQAISVIFAAGFISIKVQ